MRVDGLDEHLLVCLADKLALDILSPDLFGSKLLPLSVDLNGLLVSRGKLRGL